jgi:hypothetical protein
MENQLSYRTDIVPVQKGEFVIAVLLTSCHGLNIPGSSDLANLRFFKINLK